MKEYRPWWFAVIALVSALPALAFPTMLNVMSYDTGLSSGFVWFYPFYAVAAALLAWICYPRRRALSWVLIALMWLTHAAMWLLVLGDGALS